jgi:hypothetical protein
MTLRWINLDNRPRLSQKRRGGFPFPRVTRRMELHDPFAVRDVRLIEEHESNGTPTCAETDVRPSQTKILQR